MPQVEVTTAKSENYVLPNSSELFAQIQLMKLVKEKGPASELKICITCWVLLTSSEAEEMHKKHYLTGTFAQMATCSPHSFSALCQSKQKTQNSAEGQKLLLFGQTEGFKSKVQSLVASVEPIKLIA